MNKRARSIARMKAAAALIGWLCALTVLAAGVSFGAQVAKPENAAGELTVLGAGGYWRQHVTRRPPLVSTRSASAAGIALDEAARAIKSGGSQSDSIISGRSDPPPADWMAREFDDTAWGREAGAITGQHEFALICRRARFQVNDPAAVKKLSLEVGFCGGVLVYLNGVEVLRSSMPKGAITPETPAADYPDAAFFVKDGPRAGKLLHSYNDRMLKDQFALRRRTAGPMSIPIDRLRKGTNVLAVEVHRSDYPAGCGKQGPGEWAPAGLAQLFLRAECDAGAVVASVIRPNGFQVWNAEITEEVTELDYGTPCEPLSPMRILALRNGTFSGQVVASSTGEIAGLKAELGELVRAGGKEAIPATAIAIRYGRPGDKMRERGGSVYGGPNGPTMGVYFRRFDGLADEPPAAVPPTAPGEKLDAGVRRALGLPERPAPAALVPIWLSVKVPADAAAGTYKADLTIKAKDENAVTVPVELEVFDWRLPDMADYVSEFSVYQSPDTLAAFYKVPLWSDEHWKLIEKSVKLIGEAGNHTVILPLLSKEQVGNEESYMYWIRQADGGFKYDARNLERYVDLCLKYHDAKRIKAVCLVVWGNAGVASGNPYQKEKYDERGLPTATRGKFTVTLLDPKTGAKSDLELPPMGSKEYEEFWRAALAHAKGVIEKRGLADRIRVGMPADPPVPALVVKVFHDILPESGWFVGNHPGSSGYGYELKDRSKIMPSLHVERVYTGPLPEPTVKRALGWQRKDMTLAFNRYGFGPLCLFPDPQVWAFRILMETDLASGHRGAGRIGADYWNMGTGTGSGGAGTFYARYPNSAIGQTGLASNCAALLAPGPAGPVTTARFENLREGIQNAEAVIFVQKALLAGTVPDELAARAWRILDERTNAARVYSLGLGRSGWQERDRALYALAVEISKHKGGAGARN